MKKGFLFLSVFLLAFILNGCSLSQNQPPQSSASWPFWFVKLDGNIYKITQEPVQNIGQKIGTVTSYSDKEGTYEGNFSNAFPVGTNLYEIKGVSKSESIAVESQTGKFIKATNANSTK